MKSPRSAGNTSNPGNEPAPGQTREKQHDRRDPENQRGAAEVRGLQHEQGHQPDGDSARRQDPGLTDPLGAAVNLVGEKEDDGDLGQLGRLERDRSKGQPPAACR